MPGGRRGRLGGGRYGVVCFSRFISVVLVDEFGLWELFFRFFLRFRVPRIRFLGFSWCLLISYRMGLSLFSGRLGWVIFFFPGFC